MQELQQLNNKNVLTSAYSISCFWFHKTGRDFISKEFSQPKSYITKLVVALNEKNETIKRAKHIRNENL